MRNLYQTFSNADAFIGDGIENWNTSSVTEMYRTFSSTRSFTGDTLSNWDTSSVTDMRWIFWHVVFSSSLLFLSSLPLFSSSLPALEYHVHEQHTLTSQARNILYRRGSVELEHGESSDFGRYESFPRPFQAPHTHTRSRILRII